MNDDARKKIVVTGSLGYLGRTIVPALRRQGHEVHGLDAVECPDDPCFTRIDFLRPDETRKAFEQIGPFDTLIHLAAIAHHQKIEGDYDECTINVEILKNVLDAIPSVDHLIFFSSVAVYGEESHASPVSASAALHPASRYGEGKKRCEELIRYAATSPCVDILRPAPVYDSDHRVDLSKRVYMPCLKLKMSMYPSPRYSFCHIDTLRDRVLERVANGWNGIRCANVADPEAIGQRELSRQFPGIAVPVIVPILFPFYYLMKGMPGRVSYKVRSLFRKLFTDNIYDLATIEQVRDEKIK